MPGGDRTGPRGMGSRTGRAAGYCTGNDMPGYANTNQRGGFGRRARGGYGRGFGGGFGVGFGRGGGARIRGGWREEDRFDAPIPNDPEAAAPMPAADPQEPDVRVLQDQLIRVEATLGELGERIAKLQAGETKD